MTPFMEWKEFRKTDVPMKDEETGEAINEHELFCLWFLCQLHYGYADEEIDDAVVAIEAASHSIPEAPEFDDMNYIAHCLECLEEKTLLTRTPVRSFLCYVN